jgi:hypothetical protein
VEFRGMVCEIQIHCEAHYDLKDEQHVVYSLCRELGLMGDKRGDEGAAAAAAGNRGRLVRPSLARRMAVSVLRAGASTFAITFGTRYAIFAYHDTYRTYDRSFTGFLLWWKALSLCLPCWIIGGVLLRDMWKDGKGGFLFCLVLTRKLHMYLNY